MLKIKNVELHGWEPVKERKYRMGSYENVK